MKLCFILGLMATMPAAMARDFPVVKIISGVCGQEDRQFIGSGVLIDVNGKPQVLTSSHILIHRDDGVCHRMVCSFCGDKMSLQISKIDIGKGLALLTSDELKNKAVDFHPLGSSKIIETTELGFGDRLAVSGYERNETESPTIDLDVSIIKFNSTTHNLPTLSNVIEVDAKAMRGMSGGGVFTEDGLLVGLLSHQARRIVEAGQEAIITGRLSDNRVETFAELVIPGEVIGKWIRDIESGVAKDIRLDPVAQMSGVVQFEAADLVFREHCFGFDDEGKPIGGDGIGIGGDGIGIGGDGIGIGGDGVGIGGTAAPIASVPTAQIIIDKIKDYFPERVKTGAGLCVIELRHKISESVTEWPFHGADTIADMTSKLIFQNKLWVIGLAFRGRPMPLFSLMSFFKRLGDPEYRPMVPILGSSRAINGYQDKSAAISELLELVSENIESPLVADSTDGNIAKFRRDLMLLSKMLRLRQYDLIPDYQFSRLYQPTKDSVYGHAVRKLLETDYDATVKLLKRLRDLHKRIQEVRL